MKGEWRWNDSGGKGKEGSSIYSHDGPWPGWCTCICVAFSAVPFPGDLPCLPCPSDPAHVGWAPATGALSSTEACLPVLLSLVSVRRAAAPHSLSYALVWHIQHSNSTFLMHSSSLGSKCTYTYPPKMTSDVRIARMFIVDLISILVPTHSILSSSPHISPPISSFPSPPSPLFSSMLLFFLYVKAGL